MQSANPARLSGLSRRRLGLGTAALALLGAGAARSAPADPAAPIVQPAGATPRAFIERAFAMQAEAERAGDQGFGAVVVRDGRIIGEAPSRVVTARDPTAHAEMEAIRDAARRAGGSVAGATLYSSFRPCPMCEAAAAWAGIARMVHGQAISDAGAPQLRRC
jgi:tRNA(Arg) A34 adenosine deaminase TadA